MLPMNTATDASPPGRATCPATTTALRKARRPALAVLLAVALGLSGCATRAAPDAEAASTSAGSEQTGTGAGGQDIGRGVASWYGERFHGRRTASGETFDMNELTAAHRSLPFGTRVRVRHANTGKEVTVRINDRGPSVKGRIIDLSRAAAVEIGIVRSGVGPVVLLRD